MTGLADFVAPIVDMFTSGPAFAAYVAVAGSAVAMGVAAKIGPRLWRYFWRFSADTPEVSDETYNAYAEAREARSAETAEWRRQGRLGLFDPDEKQYANWNSGTDGDLPAQTLDRYRNEPS